MTAAYRVFVADLADVEKVTLVCPSCEAALSLNIEVANIPERCSSCGRVFRDNARDALAALARFQREGKRAEQEAGKQMFRFEIREKEQR